MALVLVLVASLLGGVIFLVRGAKSRRDALLAAQSQDEAAEGDDLEAEPGWDADESDDPMDPADTGRHERMPPSLTPPSPVGA